MALFNLLTLFGLNKSLAACADLQGLSCEANQTPGNLSKAERDQLWKNNTRLAFNDHPYQKRTTDLCIVLKTK